VFGFDARPLDRITEPPLELFIVIVSGIDVTVIMAAPKV
jgi:hypothetical protein